MDEYILHVIRKTRLTLEQMSVKKEDESLVMQDYEIWLVMALSLCTSHHLGEHVTSSLRCASIIIDDFNELRASVKVRNLGE